VTGIGNLPQYAIIRNSFVSGELKEISKTIENIVRGARDLCSLTRIDLYQDRIKRIAFANGLG
jgi:hypothetical protein